MGVGIFDSTTRTSRAELSGMLTDMFPDVELDLDSVAGHRLPLSSGGVKLTIGPVLLAGDAAGLIDPLTGEGVHTALLSGLLAGAASVIDPETAPAAYHAMISASLGRHLRHLRIAARPTRQPRTLEAVIAAAAHHPHVARSATAFALDEDTTRAWRRLAPTLLR